MHEFIPRPWSKVGVVTCMGAPSSPATTLAIPALLDWRNTPTEGVGTSPAQRFLGRTLLPTTYVRLTPHYQTDDSALAINILYLC